MRYKITEVFYSLQGEGFHAGTPAIFIRFSGCNLSCAFCDTDHSQYRELTAVQVKALVMACAPSSFYSLATKRVILTGGEPTLQVGDGDRLINSLRSSGFILGIESNGTKKIPSGIDWVSISPKNNMFPRALLRADEIKVVLAPGIDPSRYETYRDSAHLFIQPCSQNFPPAVDYVLKNPLWRLSLQCHRVLNIK